MDDAKAVAAMGAAGQSCSAIAEALSFSEASSSKSVLVSFREDEMVEEIALSELELVEVRRS